MTATMTATMTAATNAAPNAAIVGWAHTPFGKHDAETVESLIVRAANEALAHAGLDAADVRLFRAGFHG
jgi:acetyl-CoA acetyltransferase